jgi:ankyrin repeat protein
MKSIPRENMAINTINIERLNGTKEFNDKLKNQKHYDVIFLYDALDEEREKRIEELINKFSDSDLKISKLGCSPFGNDTASEKKLIFLEGLGKNIESGKIGSNTIIFMNFHTYSSDSNLSFSIKGIDKNIRIRTEEVYKYVWSFFTEGEKPSFHNLGCNAGYYSEDLRDGIGHVINYAGKSTIGARENISQAKEVLRFISISKNFDHEIPSPEKIWRHMEHYVTQEMSFTGKGSYMVHQPMRLPSSTINGHFNYSKGHKNPKLLIEYAFRHRPMEQVLELIKEHDPTHKIIRNFDEKTKKRILFHLIPNRVSWINFSQNLLGAPVLEKVREHIDSLQKFLFCHENNLFPKSIGQERANHFLIICCKEGNEKVAKYIFEMSEFPISNSGKESALAAAIQSENVELVKILMQHVDDFYIQDQMGNSLFHYASNHPNSAIMELLLMPEALVKYSKSSPIEQRESREFLINEKNDDGTSPLELAIKKNNPETVKLLLEAGANPRIQNSKGKNFLHQAVFRGSHAIVKLLLESGLKDTVDNMEMSRLLHRAILKSEKEITLMLVAHCAAAGKKAALNTRNAYGLTPILLAAKKRDIKLITALLAAGADPAVSSNSDQNALHKISKELRISQEKSLQATSNVTKTPSEKLVNQELDFSQTETILKTLIDHGVSVNKIDNDGNTPTMIAAQAHNPQLVYFFLSHGADINVINHQGHSVLHYALQHQDKNLSKYLIGKGIDLNTARFDLDTALSLARNSNDTFAIEHIRTALDNKQKQ